MSNRVAAYAIAGLLGILLGVVGGVATAPDATTVSPPASTTSTTPASLDDPDILDNEEPVVSTVDPADADAATDAGTVAPLNPVTTTLPPLDSAAVVAALQPTLVPLEGAACGGARQAVGVRAGSFVITADPLRHYAGQLWAAALIRLEDWTPMDNGLAAFVMPGAASPIPTGTAPLVVGTEVLLVSTDSQIPGIVTGLDGATATLRMDRAVPAAALGSPIGIGDGAGPLLVATSTDSPDITATIVSSDDVASLQVRELFPPPCDDERGRAPLTPNSWASLDVPANRAAMIIQRMHDAIPAGDYATFDSIVEPTVSRADFTAIDKYGSNKATTVMYTALDNPATDAWIIGFATDERIEFLADETRIPPQELSFWFCVRWRVDTDAGTVDLDAVTPVSGFNNRADPRWPAPGWVDHMDLYETLQPACVRAGDEN